MNYNPTFSNAKMNKNSETKRTNMVQNTDSGVSWRNSTDNHMWKRFPAYINDVLFRVRNLFRC